MSSAHAEAEVQNTSRIENPEQKIYKDNTLKEAREYYKKHQECIKSFDKYYKKHKSLIYLFDEDHKYNIDQKARKEIEDISYIHDRASRMKLSYLSIVASDLHDYETISAEEAAKRKESIESCLNEYKKNVDWLDDLEAYLVLNPQVET
jgi:hypothetical protein